MRCDDKDGRGKEGQCLATARKGIESKSRGTETRRGAGAVKGEAKARRRRALKGSVTQGQSITLYAKANNIKRRKAT